MFGTELVTVAVLDVTRLVQQPSLDGVLDDPDEAWLPTEGARPRSAKRRATTAGGAPEGLSGDGRREREEEVLC